MSAAAQLALYSIDFWGTIGAIALYWLTKKHLAIARCFVLI
ncbi:hypothetical protein [Aliterella atlantica]|nr:hypothetical protein [Aliterella atlantica]